jgi:hypothetical protein
MVLNYNAVKLFFSAGAVLNRGLTVSTKGAGVSNGKSMVIALRLPAFFIFAPQNF